MAEHTALVEWRGPAVADFLAGHYSRAHTVSFDGGVSIPGSASPGVVRAPWSVEAAADPEEMLIAAVSACHMLTFLDLAKHGGFAVASYSDRPVGRMGRIAAGRYAVTQIALRPQIAWAPGLAPSAEALATLHHRAHEACFIANSVSAEIVVEAAGDAEGAPA